MKKFAAMLLAVALLWSCTASLVTARATSLSDSANELHFIIRHWHTKDDASNSQFQGGSLDSSGDRYFVVVEGYIVPNADPIGNRNYEFYMVCQSDTTIDNEYYKKGDRVLIHNSGEVGVNGSAYIEELDHEHGVITLSTNQLSKDHSDDDAEVFSSYSVSAGHDAVQTKGARMTITYKENIHLVKAHAFYVKTTVDTEDGTQDDTVFGSGGISGSLEQDTAMVYTYKEKKEGMDGHEKGEIVKVKGQPFTGFKKDKYGNHLMDADGLFIMDEAALKAAGINPDDVVVTKVYDSGKGLHTDKTASVSADTRFYVDVLDQEGNPTGVKEPDGRTFDLDLETWHSEGFAPQIGMVLDASGSMAFASDTPKAIKVEDGTALYDSLKHKIGTYNSNFKMEDDFIAKHLVGYYEFRNNNADNNRTWYLNSKKYANTTINYNELRQHLDYFAKLVVQSTDDNEINFSAANQRTLIAYDDGGYYSGGWGNVPANFNGTYLALNLAGDWLANKSQGSGFLLESATEFEESDFTLSFTLKQTKETNPGDVEILYVGEETGTRSDSSYFHVIRRNNDIVVSCAANGEETTLFSLPTGFGNGVQRVITFVFKNNSVTAYMDGVEKAKASVPNLSHEAIVFAPFKNRSTTATEFWLDSVCLFDAALDEGEIYALTSLHSSKAVTGSNATGATIAEMKAITSIDAFLTPGELALLMNPNKTDNSIFGWAGYSYFVYNPAGGNNLGYVPLGYYNYGANGATPGNSSRFGGEGWYYISSTGWANVKDGNSKAYNGLAGGTYKDEITAREAALPSTTNVNGGTAPDADENFVPKNTSSTYNATANGPAKFYIDGDGYLRCFYGVSNTACITSYVYELDDSEYIRTEALQRALGLFVTQLDERSPASRVSAVRFSGAAATSDKLFLLDWTDEPSKSTGMLSLGQDDINVYKYILTGGTDTAKGLTAYKEKLQSGDNPYGDAGEPPKYLIIFTDGSDDNIKSPGNIQNIAKQLKDDDYTIYTVLLDGGTMGTTQYGEVEEFLTSLAGTKDTSTKEERSAYFYSTHKAREEDEESQYDDVSDADVLTQVFVNDILDRVIEPLEDYEIKDYIDPRFDLVDEDGTVWHLNAGGEVKKELANGNTEVLPKLTENVGVEFHLTDHSDEEARKPKLYYDHTNDMYYLKWTNQTIPSSAVGANRLPVWNARVTIRAKDDFLGGNAIVSNGNMAKMNYVYADDDENPSSGTDRANPPEGATYSASKGFPRTAVNVTPAKDKAEMGQVIYMGEELYASNIAVDLIRSVHERASGLEEYYWEYLERFITYFNEPENRDELLILRRTKIDANDTSDPYDPDDPSSNPENTDYDSNVDHNRLVTARLLETAKEGKLSVETLTEWMVEDRKKGLTLPYIYLPDKAETDSTGTDTHRKDMIGRLTYIIHDTFSNVENEEDLPPDIAVYPDGMTTHTITRLSELTVTYDSKVSEERMAWNNTNVVREKDENGNLVYKRDPAYKPVPGNVATKIPIDGTFTTTIVSGEIALLVDVTKEAQQRLQELNQTVTYTADLYFGSDRVGTFTAQIRPGDTLVNATIEFQSDYAIGVPGQMADMAHYGLPYGTYSLKNGRGEDVPDGFAFGDIVLTSEKSWYDPAWFSKGVGNDQPQNFIAETNAAGDAFLLGIKNARPNDDNYDYRNSRFGVAVVQFSAALPGQLTVTKAIRGNAPASMTSEKAYTFTITGPEEVKNKSYNNNTVSFNDNGQATVTIKGAGNVTIKDLPSGDYTVAEDKTGAALEGYALTVTGGGAVTITEAGGAAVTVTNTYAEIGSLVIAKIIESDAPEAYEKAYSFTITGPAETAGHVYTLGDGETIAFDASGKTEVTITGEGSVSITDLPVGLYTVTEDKNSAEIGGCTLVVTGEGDAAVTRVSGAVVTVKNTYTEKPGSLTINKIIEGGEADASGKVYSFIVTGPDASKGKTYGGVSFDASGRAVVTITGAGSMTIANLPAGVYKVTEDKNGAALDGYTLTVTGEGSITIPKDGSAAMTVTNTYTAQPGRLTVTKTLGANSPAEASSKKYTITITGPEEVKNHIYDGVRFDGDRKATVAFTGAGTKTIAGLPAGSYTVMEDRDGTEIEGYTLEVTGEGVATITRNGGAAVTVTNTYTAIPSKPTAEPTQTPTAEPTAAPTQTPTQAPTQTPTAEPTTEHGDLAVSKTVTGSGGDKAQEFSFMVILGDKSINGVYGDMTFHNGVANFTLKHGESKTATDLSVGDYSVVELSATQDGYAVTSMNEKGTIQANDCVQVLFVNAREEIDVPQTGDDSRLELLIALTIASMLGIAASCIVLHRESRRKTR